MHNLLLKNWYHLYDVGWVVFLNNTDNLENKDANSNLTDRASYLMHVTVTGTKFIIFCFDFGPKAIHHCILAM